MFCLPDYVALLNSLSPAFWREWTHVIVLVLLFSPSRYTAAEEFRIGGGGTALGTMQILAKEFVARNPDIQVTVENSLGSNGGIMAVVSGAIDLAVTSRPMKESERKLGAVEMEYARTPFVFAVSTRSRVTGITSGELADIYAGKMTNWADGSPIRIVLRPISDIDTEIAKGISPAIARELAAAMTRPGMLISPTDQKAADAIERIPGAIGPTSLAVIVSEKRTLRALKLDGREPSLMNAASGVYPYSKRLFLVTNKIRPTTVEHFVAFVQSPAGRKILTGSGQWIP